jgi:hypothetical protein
MMKLEWAREDYILFYRDWDKLASRGLRQVLGRWED